ncbi:Hint domain-containing protein [Loktanella sp. IMCC34160]|uniref:Hint domain-containing protein n=1 Tax=Loktanella sp. IMCC34160 TaxID=2510646 RepID=UPI0013EC7271|nr:Hint domain-containing protein [Loktanella sp. IMCC34160]
MSPVDTSSVDPAAYDKDNSVANDTFSIDGGPPQTFDTVVIYNVTIHYADGTPDATASVSLIQDTDGNLYLVPEYTNNPDVATLGAAPIESITIDSISSDPSWMFADRVATDFVCFSAGTPILTAQGEVWAETLRPGDLVMTVDRGFQPLKWVHRSDQNWDGAPHKGKPILIGRGALGMGLPNRDLVVSPQHRILVPHPNHPEGVLVPAKSLTHLPKVRQMRGLRSATYVHMLFDHHEVILSAGAPTESLYPGKQALRTLTSADRDAVRKVVLRSGSGFAPARRFLRPGKGELTALIRAPVWTEERLAAAGILSKAVADLDSKGGSQSYPPKRTNPSVHPQSA